ncbi:MAG TPA: MBL fold metallo-hydrolase [Vicinamibacteria bacterium]
MRTRWRAVLAAVVVTALAATARPAAPLPRGLDIYWIDVEGGAATLIVTPAGESVLVDTGWPLPRDTDRIQQAVREAGVSRIDHLVTTHWHGDHVGGVAPLAQRLPIGRYYDHGFPEGKPSDVDAILRAAYLVATQGRSTVLHAGDEIRLRQAPSAPPVSLRVVASDGIVVGEAPGSPQTRPCTAKPPHAAIPDDTSDNFRSVGLRLSYGGFHFLDLGDLTWNVEHKLVCPKNLLGTVDVYQVTHHGADNSNNPALVAAVAPTVAVIDNGAKKGGTPAAYKVLRQTPSIKDVFQLHRNVATTAADNPPPELTANDDEACQGEWIRLRVDPPATSYTVEVHGKGTKRTYAVK